MGRKERRKAEREAGIKKKSAYPFLPPVAPISIESFMAKHPEIVESVRQWEVKVRKEAADRSLNLTMAAMIIELYRKYDFEQDQLKRAMTGAMNYIQMAWQNIVSFEELITVCEKIGMDSMDLDYSKVNKSVEEVMEYIRQWEGLKEDMSKRDEVFKCMNDGIKETAEIVKITGIKKGTVESYKSLWEKEELKKQERSGLDKFVDSLFDEEDGNQNQSECAKNVGQEEKKEVVDKTIGNEEKDETSENNAKCDAIEEVSVKKKKRKITITKTIEGDFGTHTIINELAEVKFDTYEMMLTKEQVEELIDELQDVRDNM